MPPPLTFDLDALPSSTLLSDSETAAACRRSKAALENWRKDPAHPLQWRRVAGRVLYELASIRAFLKGADDRRTRQTARSTSEGGAPDQAARAESAPRSASSEAVDRTSRDKAGASQPQPTAF